MISVLGAEKLSLVEIEAFLAASESVRFVGCGRTEIYGWVERLLCHHEYPLQKRRAKGPLRDYQEEYGWPSEPVSSEPEWTSSMPGSVSSSEYMASLVSVTQVSLPWVMGSSGMTLR